MLTKECTQVCKLHVPVFVDPAEMNRAYYLGIIG